MTDVALTILAMIGGGVTLELFAAGSPWAPLGYADRRGLHLVPQAAAPEPEMLMENPS